LASADIENSAAEVHGVISGLLCGGSDDAERIWLSELMPEDAEEGDLLVEECRTSLGALYQATYEATSDPDFIFAAFLPDDDKGIVVRGRAVADWCSGFMYGLGLAGTAEQGKLSGDAAEALQSLSEISQMDVTALQETEEEEFALLDVIEFIWVAAILIRSELVSN